MVRINVTIFGVDAVCHDDPFAGAEDRRCNASVAGTIILTPNEWLENKPPLNFMVVLSDNPLLACDIRACEDAAEIFSQLCRINPNSGLGFRVLRRVPNCLFRVARQAVVEEAHIEVGLQPLHGKTPAASGYR